jgi:hypothetical protein
MKYIERLKEIFTTYKTIETIEQYKGFLNIRVQKLLKVPELAGNLSKSGGYWKDKDECLSFLIGLLDWLQVPFEAKKEFDEKSNNMQNLESFKNAIGTFKELLSQNELDNKVIFRECIHLSMQFSESEITSKEITKKAASQQISKIHQTAIRQSREYISSFLKIFSVEIDKNLDDYFSQFARTKHISFPVAFINDNPSDSASIETCDLWLDIDDSSNKIDLNPLFISFNRSKGIPYEERSIGTAIKQAVSEAEKDFNYYIIGGTKKKLALRNIFFQIGNLNDNLDGTSIGVAAFFAALTLLDGRELPENLFFTGRLDANDLKINGVYEKAKKGMSVGYNSLIIPKGNLNELTAGLNNDGIPYSILDKQSELLPADTKSHLAIFPYDDVRSLFSMWDAWKDVSGLNFQMNRRNIFSGFLVASMWWTVGLFLIKGMFSSDLRYIGYILLGPLAILLLTLAAHGKLPGLTAFRQSYRKLQRERYAWPFKEWLEYILWCTPFAILNGGLLYFDYFLTFLVVLVLELIAFIWAVFIAD